MYDLFENAKVETSADTREKVVRALGFDEPPVEQKLSRSSFNTDEEYFDACARLAVQNHSPEYRREYERIRREYTAKQDEERQAQEEAEHQAKIAQATPRLLRGTPRTTTPSPSTPRWALRPTARPCRRLNSRR